MIWKSNESIKYYEKFLLILEEYFNVTNWKKLFLQGGCYWFANTLHQGISNSKLMINRTEEHCGLFFENGLYDVSGKISRFQFRDVTEKDISFMKKNYIPHFDTQALEAYLVKIGLPVCC